MYAAQQHAAPRAQSTPTTSTGPCHGSVSSTTPTAARPGQISARREWLRAAATPSGPRNSSALAVPSGSRTAAAMKSNVTPAVTMPSADAATRLLRVKLERRGRTISSMITPAHIRRSHPAPSAPMSCEMPIAAAMPTWTQLIEATAIAVPARVCVVLMHPVGHAETVRVHVGSLDMMFMNPE